MSTLVATWHPPRAATATVTDDALLELTASALFAKLDVQAGAIAQAVCASTPDLPEWILPDVHAACSRVLEVTYRSLLDGAEAALASTDTDQTAERFVLIGLGVDVIVRIVRIAHQQISTTLYAQQLDKIGAAHDFFDAVARVSEMTFACIERVIDALVVSYADVQQRHGDTGQAAQAATFRAILSGTLDDPVKATQRLRYRLDGHHVAFVVWGPSGHAAPEALRTAAEECVRALGGTDVLCVAQGTANLACWTRVPPTEATAHGRPLTLGARLAVRVAMGEGHHGLDGFRRSHEEAEKARRIATFTRRPPGSCTTFADVALLVLLSADLAAARRYVSARLGALASDDIGTRRLADTLAVYYEEGCNQTRTAARLQIHVKSVRYRTRRAEDLLGYSVDRHMLETRTALMLLQMIRTGDGELPSA